MNSLSRPGFCLLVVIALLFPVSAFSKIFPSEGARLNYRIIGFSFPQVSGSSDCRLEIASGKVPDDRQFTPLIVLPATGTDRLIAEVPDFGAEYTWRVVYFMRDGKTTKTKLFHFSTLGLPNLGGNQSRLRVTRESDLYAGNYLLVDGASVMYDMKGNAVWFLPKLDSAEAQGMDIKCTGQHTLTMLYGAGSYETDYNGRILWKGPDLRKLRINRGNGGSAIIPPYHHELTRLRNGHYMTLGCTPGMAAGIPDRQQGNTKQRRFFNNASPRNTLYEFDARGKVIWSWNSMDYISHSDIGIFGQDLAEKWQMPVFDAHENSFYFDETGSTIYLSYAALNRIVEISYPSGKVLATYGKQYDTIGDRATLRAYGAVPERITDLISLKMFDNGMFCGQHAVSVTGQGELLMFNDNMFRSGTPPQVLILKKQEQGQHGQLKKVWEFTCPTDVETDKQRPNGGGGSVMEMADNSLYVTMNGPFEKLFIVNRNKEITWMAVAENMTVPGVWKSYAPYRSGIITRAELEQLIWNSEPDDDGRDLSPFSSTE